MTSKGPIRILALILLFLRVETTAQQASQDLTGTLSGTFISSQSDISPFTITVKINKNSSGHLVGDASLVSDCLDSHRLDVTVNGSNVLLAGSDAKGRHRLVPGNRGCHGHSAEIELHHQRQSKWQV